MDIDSILSELAQRGEAFFERESLYYHDSYTIKPQPNHEGGYCVEHSYLCTDVAAVGSDYFGSQQHLFPNLLSLRQWLEGVGAA